MGKQDTGAQIAIMHQSHRADMIRPAKIYDFLASLKIFSAMHQRDVHGQNARRVFINNRHDAGV
jgi:hypothetical protein